MATGYEQAAALLAAGREGEAIALVRAAAQRGEAWGLYILAECKLAGQGMSRDPRGAVELLERSAGLGWPAAAMRLVTLYASGTGCTEQPAKARQIVDLGRGSEKFAEMQARVLEREPDGSQFPVEILSKDPDIRLFKGVLSAAECQWIAQFAQPFLEPSYVEDPKTGARIPHPVRTSKGMSFGPLQEDLVINRINRRIARLSTTEYAWGEPLHVLSYEVGQEYKPHLDALPGADNQRQATAILYVNDGYQGGETVFPKLRLEVEPEAGDMLLFANLDSHGKADQRTEHAGRAVEWGHKWIATRWVRQRRYHPWEPATH